MKYLVRQFRAFLDASCHAFQKMIQMRPLDRIQSLEERKLCFLPCGIFRIFFSYRGVLAAGAALIG